MNERRRTVALACRVLANTGLAEDILGHVSLRVAPGALLVRCRGPREEGLLFTVAEDVHEVGLDGCGDLGEWSVPQELPIHTEIMRARPDVDAVVHCHPPSVLAAGLAGVELRPVFGASMGDAAVCVMTGHGIATVGAGPHAVEQAVGRALALDVLARVNLEQDCLGARPNELTPADIAELPDLGAAFNDLNLWRHHLARLRLAGLDLR